VVLDSAVTERRTQAERTATTRKRLLDATIDCLTELGYAGTSTTEVAKRAGVSRGAQLHHFPTKADLVATAVDHLFAQRHEEFRVAFATLPAGIHPVDGAIDLLWEIISGPSFAAWLELVVAARTDPELHERLQDVSGRFMADVIATFASIFPAPDDTTPTDTVAPTFAFALLDGLALERLTGSGTPVEGVLAAFKALAKLAIPLP
jgi:AcrR family transcriptional regulator